MIERDIREILVSSSNDKHKIELINTPYDVGKAIRLKPCLDEGDQMEEIFNNLNKEDRDIKIKEYKEKFLYPNFLINPNDVPDSYFALKIKIAKERGESEDYQNDGINSVKDIDDATRKKAGETIYNDQKESLDIWIDYLVDNNDYPTWFKYFTLRGVLKIGSCDKKKNEFNNRNKETVACFPDLNREALPYVKNILVDKYGEEYLQLQEHIIEANKKLDSLNNYENHYDDKLNIIKTGKDKDGRDINIKEKDLKKIEQSLSKNTIDFDKEKVKAELTELIEKQNQYLESKGIPSDFWGYPKEENFGKLYIYAVDKVTSAFKENKEKIDGEWTKFNQGSNYTVLYESLKGHSTGWCTAEKETAKSQLEGGDFYVYYSKDEEGGNTIPRIAIRMENGQVAEVRGIQKDQNMEASMTDIAKEKYHQLPGGEKFEKKDGDMKKLTLIDKKVKDKQVLTKEELKFLYEIDNKIEGFGYKKDPRIKEILLVRNIKQDISSVFDFKPEQISTNNKEALMGDIKYHYGNLNLNDITSGKEVILPKRISGYLKLNGLTSAKGLILPEYVSGHLELNGLTSAEGLILPEYVRGHLELNGLTSAEGLILPEYIGGFLYLKRITSAKGLILPKHIESDLDLSGLTSAKDLILPNNIGGDLYLSGLTSIEGLVLPNSIGNRLFLNGLTSNERELLRKQYPKFRIL